MRDFREQGRGHRGHRHDGGHDGEGFEGRGRRGGRMRRGDIRTALLAILVEEPGHGYDLIQRLEEKTAGAWRPSPGSVYPTLQLLEDEGLVRSIERDGKRVFEITDQGRAEATGASRSGRNPVGDRRTQRHRSATSATRSRQLLVAAKQVSHSATSNRSSACSRS